MVCIEPGREVFRKELNRQVKRPGAIAYDFPKKFRSSIIPPNLFFIGT